MSSSFSQYAPPVLLTLLATALFVEHNFVLQMPHHLASVDNFDQPEPEKGHSRIRRSFHAPDKLISQPGPSIDTVHDSLQYAIRTHGKNRCVGMRSVKEIHTEKKVVNGKEKEWKYFELGPYEWWSYEEFGQKVREAGSGLRNLGFEKGNRFNIYSNTCANWQVLANACASHGIPFATSYDSLGEEGLQHSLNEPEILGIFTNANLLGTLSTVLPNCPTVKFVIYDGPSSDVPKGSLEKLDGLEGVKVLHIDELLKLGREKDFEPSPAGHDDVACVMYTSGSTGPPKGVLLTNGNIVASIGGIKTLLGHLLSPEDLYIGYLPLAHVMEFVVESCFFYVGIPIGYGSPKTLTDTSVRNCLGDIRELKPTIMVGVPSVWELIRKGIVGRVKSSGAIKQNLFQGGLSLKKATSGSKILSGTVGNLVDSVVFKQVKAATGGRLRFAMNGGAPISRESQEFLNIALVTMLQGYGMTESCGMCTVLTPEFYGYGTVGCMVPSIESKLVDVEEAGYFVSNNPPQGEVWIRGPSVTRGYFKRDDVTADTITSDGWLKTGDIGQYNPDGTLNIIDRKKNLIKLSGGEYIALERLESIYKASSSVGNICVHATSEASKPMAIISVHQQHFTSLLNSNGFTSESHLEHDELEKFCHNKKVQELVLNEVNNTGKKAGLKGLEQLQCIVLTSEEWTPASGLLTAAQKLQRKDILKHYGDQVNAMYP